MYMIFAHFSVRSAKDCHFFKMNKSVLLIVLPCLVALVTVSAQWGGAGAGYNQYYQQQFGAYNAQNRLYTYGNQATAQLQSAKLLNYLFGFLLLLDITNATGNTNGQTTLFG